MMIVITLAVGRIVAALRTGMVFMGISPPLAVQASAPAAPPARRASLVRMVEAVQGA
jgi:hypothetical protein